ncbi:glycerol-3-phosphate ABC transporter, ATP-binding protein UgpC [Anopheles sinensis]|uniref:Glycerol-3-phosphate ABC transporter, ATP-binding protein UgpC n=1 Tax=Anopheles sinensis TaxID=74873 RepID=A0A084WHY9_ANOSI|nr:glycerol-3-phosphate ABC transporter, ATP-binding protein UgpC [Anopheles sinensis]
MGKNPIRPFRRRLRTTPRRGNRCLVFRPSFRRMNESESVVPAEGDGVQTGGRGVAARVETGNKTENYTARPLPVGCPTTTFDCQCVSVAARSAFDKECISYSEARNRITSPLEQPVSGKFSSRLDAADDWNKTNVKVPSLMHTKQTYGAQTPVVYNFKH